jgi:hypothetical protein
MSSFLGWLRKIGEITAVPAIPWPTVREHAPRLLSADAQKRVLAAIPERSRGIFLALALLGLRPSEAARLVQPHTQSQNVIRPMVRQLVPSLKNVLLPMRRALVPSLKNVLLPMRWALLPLLKNVLLPMRRALVPLLKNVLLPTRFALTPLLKNVPLPMRCALSPDCCASAKTGMNSTAATTNPIPPSDPCAQYLQPPVNVIGFAGPNLKGRTPRPAKQQQPAFTQTKIRPRTPPQTTAAAEPPGSAPAADPFPAAARAARRSANASDARPAHEAAVTVA